MLQTGISTARHICLVLRTRLWTYTHPWPGRTSCWKTWLVSEFFSRVEFLQPPGDDHQLPQNRVYAFRFNLCNISCCFCFCGHFTFYANSKRQTLPFVLCTVFICSKDDIFRHKIMGGMKEFAIFIDWKWKLILRFPRHYVSVLQAQWSVDKVT